MSNFEDLRLIDLIKKFQRTAEGIYSSRSLSLLKEAGRQLQDVYNFFVTAEGAYEEQQGQFKNLFTSFNYAAVIVNNAVKNGGLSSDDNELLNECLQIMLKCCQTIINLLEG